MSVSIINVSISTSTVSVLPMISLSLSGDNPVPGLFTSRSFLQHQVRSMVGCIKYLGDGKWNLANFRKSFQSKNRKKCAPPAPACGLYLKNVSY